MFRTLFLVIITVLSGCSAFAQGDILKKGESGFGAGYYYQNIEKSANASGIVVGYSPKGRIDYGATFIFMQSEPSMGVNVVGHLIKSSESITKLGIALLGSLELISGDSDAAYSYGVVFYSNLILSKGFYFQPSLHVANIVLDGKASVLTYGGGPQLFLEIQKNTLLNFGFSYSGSQKGSLKGVGRSNLSLSIMHRYNSN